MIMGYQTLAVDHEGKQVTVSVARSLFRVWNIIKDEDKTAALQAIGRAIISNHDFKVPLRDEYSYTTENAETSSLQNMLSYIQRNKP